MSRIGGCRDLTYRGGNVISKLWDEMTEKERWELMDQLNKEAEYSDRRYRRHIINISDPEYLQDLAESGKMPDEYGGDRILERFWNGDEDYEGSN